MLALCGLLVFLVVRRLASGSERLTGACNFAAVTLAAILLVRLGSPAGNSTACTSIPCSPT